MAGGIELGKAWVQIVPSARGLDGAISDVLNPEADSAGTKAGATLAGKIKSAAIKAGIGAAIWKTLNTGAELEQNLGGTEAVFGKHAQSLQNTAKTAYKNMGLSASDYMATANKMGSLFQGSGIEQTRSLELTTSAMQRAADVASVMGIDTSMAMESIAGAAKGNFTMMDNLGVAMNATTLQAYALEKGVNFEWNTASNAEKAELAMQMFMDRTSQYQGNFARESEQTFSGSLGAMKAAGQDFMANLMVGADVAPAMQNLVTTTTTFLFNNLLPGVVNIFASLPQAIGTAIATGLPAIGAQAAQIITSLTTGIRTYAPKVAEAMPQVVESGLAKISESGPKIAAKAGELIMTLGSAIIQNAPKLATAAMQTVSKLDDYLSDNLPTIMAKGGEMVGQLAAGVIANLPRIGAAALRIGAFVISHLGSVAGTLAKSGLSLVAGVAKGIVSGIGSHIKGAMQRAKEAITKPIEDAKAKIKGIFPLSIGRIFSNLRVPHINISGGSPPFGIGGLGTKPSISVTWAARGLILDKATLIGAGEAGREGIIPLTGEAMRPFAKTIAAEMPEGTRGTVNNNTFYVTVDGGDDPKEQAKEFVDEVERILRTA